MKSLVRMGVNAIVYVTLITALFALSSCKCNCNDRPNAGRLLLRDFFWEGTYKTTYDNTSENKATMAFKSTPLEGVERKLAIEKDGLETGSLYLVHKTEYKTTTSFCIYTFENMLLTIEYYGYKNRKKYDEDVFEVREFTSSKLHLIKIDRSIEYILYPSKK